MRSYLRPSTHRRTSANTRFAGFRRVGRPPLSHRLPFVKSRMVPYHALRPCPLPRPEHSLNRLAADPHLFSPLQLLPSPQHPQRLPSLSYPSRYLLLVKLVKHFRWMLSSSLQWPCHTYLALGGNKGTKLRIRLTRNGIIHLCSVLREFLSRLQHQPPGAVFAILTLFLLFQYVEGFAGESSQNNKSCSAPLGWTTIEKWWKGLPWSSGKPQTLNLRCILYRCFMGGS